MNAQTILNLHRALDAIDDTDLGVTDSRALQGLLLKSLGFKGIEGGGACLEDAQMSYTYGAPDPFKEQREQGQRDFVAQYDKAEAEVINNSGLDVDPLDYSG